jgi:hypothetical protein
MDILLGLEPLEVVLLLARLLLRTAIIAFILGLLCGSLKPIWLLVVVLLLLHWSGLVTPREGPLGLAARRVADFRARDVLLVEFHRKKDYTLNCY